MKTNTPAMTFQDAQSYLESFINIEKTLDRANASTFKLDRIKLLLQALDNPQEKFPIVHIAGSKGKGSTAAMTAQILKEAGYKVGLYTSPHISTFRERLRILSKRKLKSSPGEIFFDCISQETFIVLMKGMKATVKPLQEKIKPSVFSYFEILTAAAYYYFYQQKVDVAVVETGLGGRLDATNAAPAEVAVITSISLEHAHILGNTLSAIAREKAAIIKESTKKVIVAEQSGEVRGVLEERIKLYQLKPLVTGHNLIPEVTNKLPLGTTFDLTTKKTLYKDLSVSLAGAHQVINASLAVGVAESLNELGFQIMEDAIRAGLKNVSWPLRFEVIRENPVVVLDGAHNPSSMEALEAGLKKFYSNKKIICVFGASDDKQIADMARYVDRFSDKVILTICEHPRAKRFLGQDKNMFQSTDEVVLTKDVFEACRIALAAQQEDELVVFCGSLYMAAQARGIIKNKEAYVSV